MNNLTNTLSHLVSMFIIPKNKRRAARNFIQNYESYKFVRKTYPHSRIKIFGGSVAVAFSIDDKLIIKISQAGYRGGANYFCVRHDKEKFLTDAIRPYFPTIQIPKYRKKTAIYNGKKITFYEDDFIHGKTIAALPIRSVQKHANHISNQIAEFIVKLKSIRPTGLTFPKHTDGGYIHGDLTINNIILNPKTYDIVGILDWDRAEFCDSKKMFASNITEPKYKFLADQIKSKTSSLLRNKKYHHALILGKN